MEAFLAEKAVRITKARNLKGLAEEFFTSENYVEASKLFHQELIEEQEYKSLKIACLLNVGECKLRMEKPDEALLYYEKLIELGDGNVRAFYKRDRGFIEMKLLDLAAIDVRRLEELDPTCQEHKVEDAKNISHFWSEHLPVYVLCKLGPVLEAA
ncbi:hypothetical protein RJT34_18570 [Clitoria ternatea]|uniref:Uncharacterized protein n=1 Tax=Clitoria ternatea TaxID=43366 RepID=A0AAN9JE80_CLITE